MTRGWKLTENYAVDLTVLDRVREYRDGIDFIEVVSALHLYRGDHNPRWECRIGLWNWTLVGIEVYNVNHADADEEEVLE